MRVYLLLLFALLTIPCFSQDDVIEVSYDKSVIIVFEGPVKRHNPKESEDVGIAEAGNTIVLRAKLEQFAETNMIVELENGSLYEFVLRFNNAPKSRHHVIKEDKAFYRKESKDIPVATKEVKPKANVKEEKKKSVPVTEVKEAVVEQKQSGTVDEGLEEIVTKVQSQKDYIGSLGVIAPGKLKLYVGGIWFINDNYYIKLHIKNESSIPYVVSYMDFFVKPKGRIGKQGTGQVIRKTPLYPSGESLKPTVDGGGNEQVLVLVFPRFTMENNKLFHISIWEKDGGRNPEMTIEESDLEVAKTEI